MDANLVNSLTRTVESKDSINLGSYQYSHIAYRYTNYQRYPESLNLLYRNILIDPKEFKEELTKFLDNEYRVYDSILKKDIGDLTADEKEEFFFDVYSAEKAFSDMHELLSDNPFKFPVKANLLKISLLEYVNFKKKMAWDLWALVNNMRNRIILNLKDYKPEYRDSNDEDAALLYVISQVLDLDNLTIEKYFGGFDT